MGGGELLAICAWVTDRREGAEDIESRDVVTANDWPERDERLAKKSKRKEAKNGI